MSIRRLLIIAAAAGSLAVGATAPVVAATNAPPTVPPGCSGYTPNNPKLTLTVTPLVTTSTHHITAAGTLKVGKCPIRNATISLKAKPLVNGVPTGSYVVVKQTTTNSQGAYSMSRVVFRNARYLTYFRHAGGFSSVTSPTPRPDVLVHIRLSMATAKLSACRIHFHGGTSPNKPGRTIKIQNRGPKGSFNGWKTLGTATTNSNGNYTKTLTLSCSKTYNLSGRIEGDSRNLFGRAKTIFGVKPTK
jgi:hypothetical protein